LGPEDVSVTGVYYWKELTRATRIFLHPEADLAIVEFRDPPDLIGATFGEATPFAGIDNAGAMGIDVTVYGYPHDALGISSNQTTPRMMKGHIQCIVNTDRFGRSKPPVSLGGMELSVFTDVGFSGAPVFRPANPSLVAAMVTDSNQSYVGAETEEEYVTETSYSRTVYRDVVSFGLALILLPFSGWIDEMIPQQGEN
jgi:hypothetical protein